MKHTYVSVQEAANLKGVSRTTVYKAIAQGLLSAETVMGKTGLRRKDVEGWQPERKTGRRKGTVLSQEVKKRISLGQKQRWEQRKQK